MAGRFHASGKEEMILIVASDYDPEGFDLADDAIRSLRDCWGVNVQYHRIGVNREQIDKLNLQADFNPAKETSSRLASFLKRTGGDKTWECEALPPKYLQDQLREAIRANMNMDIYNTTLEQEQSGAEQILEFRKQIISEIGL